MNFILRFIATTGYTGYSPVAPGTVGSVVALIVYWLFPGLRGWPLAGLTAAFFFIGVGAATVVEKTDGHDASIITVDEVVGMWLSLLFLSTPSHWIWPAAAFVLFRFFDIVKPFPAGWSQRLPGGWGVMIDDVFAGLYTALSIQILHLIFR